MTSPTALTSSNALLSMATTTTSGSSISWQTILLALLAILVVGFIVWYLFIRNPNAGSD